MGFKYFIYRLRSMTALGVFRFILLKVTGKEYVVTGSCLSCGQCCRSINLKYRKGWIRNWKQFQELVESNPEYGRFNVVDEDRTGYLQFSCSWLTNEFECRDYENRLDICKRYPNKSSYLSGGRLLNGCGYTIQQVIPFRKYLSKETKKRRKIEKSSRH